MPSLKPGDMIPLESSAESCEVINYIAEGGQGEVYRVKYKGKEYALKWYKKPYPSEAFYNNLAENVRLGAPNSHYLWPLQITKKYAGSFGYLMYLRPSKYREFSEFLTGAVRFRSYYNLINAALAIVESFRVLHSMGYSYQDVNEGGFFIDPYNGDVLICDNDNVAPFGINLGVKGFPRYMAPEVVTDQSRPNTLSDRFSLSVLLFRMFYIDHPLEGRITNRVGLNDISGARLYGFSPVFCYDPVNDSNRPEPEAQPNVIKLWGMYPPELQMVFTRAFTDGLKDINSRLTELEWEETLVKVRGMLVRVNGREQFINVHAPQKIPDGVRFLKLPDRVVVLGEGTKLYECQTDSKSADFTKITGQVITSVMDKSLLGLRNESSSVWRIISTGAERSIAPGNAVKIVPGMKIDFNGKTGDVY